MRVAEKLTLIDKIGRELQSRFTFTEIDSFLAEFGIGKPKDDVGSNSKWVYSKAALKGASDTVVLKIAAELDMPVAGTGAFVEPPRNWKDTKALRLFISHISAEKVKAARLKECLAPYHVAGFVAHEDIHPTLEWQIEIERGLHTMDAFVAMHTKGFSQSIWTQQEIGFAVAKGVKIISLKMGEDPTGFISKHQALPRGNKSAEEIAKEIGELLSEDPRTKDRLAQASAARWAELASSEAFLRDLRQRLPISKVVGEYVVWDKRKSQPSRGDFWACCPFHSEKTPSFHVDDRKGIYHCFGCGKSGDQIRFLTEKAGMSTPDAVQKLDTMARAFPASATVILQS